MELAYILTRLIQDDRVYQIVYMIYYRQYQVANFNETFIDLYLKNKMKISLKVNY